VTLVPEVAFLSLVIYKCVRVDMQWVSMTHDKIQRRKKILIVATATSVLVVQKILVRKGPLGF